jgi:hypothetical protein
LASKGSASFRATGRRYNVARSAIRNRVIRGHMTRKKYAIARHRRTPEEELALEGWCKQLEEWGAPGRICQLRKMAEELLVAKGDTESLGLNWTSSFIKRSPDLKSMFLTPQDNNRFFSRDHDIISHFFELYSETVAKYKI